MALPFQKREKFKGKDADKGPHANAEGLPYVQYLRLPHPGRRRVPAAAQLAAGGPDTTMGLRGVSIVMIALARMP
ncbi:MAG: hypothetical protein ACLR8Y_00045 [Alistipes indistinctus]